jgi:3-deoxy-D-manno-octulosonic-acid transferase
MDGIDRERNPVIWFHVSSLGEFEQGRPVIEAIKKSWPRTTVVLTFFSPSGYEVRKKYDQADFVSYLPVDSLANARKFLELVRPVLAIFVKYDFWFNFIKELSVRSIPLVYISVIFREKQYFFHWYGGWGRKHLNMIDRIFVQDEKSASLLNEVGVKQVVVVGDTRFDRVFSIAQQPWSNPVIEQFCKGHRVFVAGSCWEQDEQIFTPLISEKRFALRYILAPHDVQRERIDQLRGSLNVSAQLYSQCCSTGLTDGCDVLILDTVGILNQVYRFADFAFIGGGYGSGLHNIQEPVTFGVPVFFGPRYQKFREAVELVRLGGVFSVNTKEELEKRLDDFLQDDDLFHRVSAICKKYVDRNRGATALIMDYLKGKFSGSRWM